MTKHVYPSFARLANTQKSVISIHRINRIKEKNHTIIFMDIEKSLDIIKHPR
jgi:hypothetical protein